MLARSFIDKKQKTKNSQVCPDDDWCMLSKYWHCIPFPCNVYGWRISNVSATHTSYLSVCVCISQREEAALRALEEQRMKEEKRRRQEETKADLDYSLKLKMKKRAKEVQQELALDMKLLEQMLTATTNEAMQSLQRKVKTVTGRKTIIVCGW